MHDSNQPQAVTAILATMQQQSEADLYKALREHLKEMEETASTLATDCGYTMSITDAEAVGAIMAAQKATLPDGLLHS